MRIAVVLVLSVLAAAGTSLLLDLRNGPAEAAQPVLDPGGARDAEISALRAELAQLRAELDAAQARPTKVVGTTSREEVLDIAAAVRAVLAEEGLLGAEGAAVRAALAEGESAEDLTVDDLLAMLNAEDLSDVQWSSIWNKAKEAGLTDALIAHFEEQAAENPNDADAQAQLGFAYIAKIQQVTDGPLKGQLGMQADKAFDRALEVDPNHWDARFTKALSYSFWPAFTGKPAQAVTQLEILVERQANLPRDPKHAQTYLMLGNLYQQQGRMEEAQQAWANGAAIFPDNAELAAQVAASQQQD
ncbi:MAG: hypothetical protein H6831_10385 [Planctomycetes bacterium]|nr:hypothetical protein [Planctomycetota bacterium]MCB9904803.1 hypothetical protein [Planctomycetota bacterium]